MSAGNARRRRPRLPEPKSLGLNHSVLTGAVVDVPRLGRNPIGQVVTLVTIEFPVLDPEDGRTLVKWAACEVEVSATLDEKHGIRELEGGTEIFVAGQLSERWEISDGPIHRRSAIVAHLIHPGTPPHRDELLIPGGRS